MTTVAALAADSKSLNSFLVTRSYVTGYAPTSDDAAAFVAVGPAPDQAQFPHVARWYKHIASFPETERAAWPPGQGSVVVTAEATKNKKSSKKQASTTEPNGHPPLGQTSSAAPSTLGERDLIKEEQLQSMQHPVLVTTINTGPTLMNPGDDVFVRAPILQRSCVVCSEEHNLCCSKCKKAFYCSNEHQQADWGAHMVNCVAPEIFDLLEFLKVESNLNILTIDELYTLEHRLRSVDDKFWLPGAKQRWFDNCRPFYSDLGFASFIHVRIFRESNPLSENCVGFLPMVNKTFADDWTEKLNAMVHIAITPDEVKKYFNSNGILVISVPAGKKLGDNSPNKFRIVANIDEAWRIGVEEGWEVVHIPSSRFRTETMLNVVTSANAAPRAKLQTKQGELAPLLAHEIHELYMRASSMVSTGLFRTKCQTLGLKPLSRCLLCLRKAPDAKTDHLMPSFVYEQVLKQPGAAELRHVALADGVEKRHAGYAFFCSACEKDRFKRWEDGACYLFKQVCNASSMDELGTLRKELSSPIFTKFALSVVWRDAMLASGHVDEIRHIANLLLLEETIFLGDFKIVSQRLEGNTYPDYCWSTYSFVAEPHYVSLAGPLMFCLQKQNSNALLTVELLKFFREAPPSHVLEFLPDYCAYSEICQRFDLGGYTDIHINEKRTIHQDVVLYRGSFQGTQRWFVYVPRENTSHACAFSYCVVENRVAVHGIERSRKLEGDSLSMVISVLTRLAEDLHLASAEGEWIPVK